MFLSFLFYPQETCAESSDNYPLSKVYISISLLLYRMSRKNQNSKLFDHFFKILNRSLPFPDLLTK